MRRVGGGMRQARPSLSNKVDERAPPALDNKSKLKSQEEKKEGGKQ